MIETAITGSNATRESVNKLPHGESFGVPNWAALLNAKQERGEYNSQDKGEMLKVQEGILHGGEGENDLSKLRKSSRWT